MASRGKGRPRQTPVRDAGTVPAGLTIPALPETVAERVSFVADLMESLQWVRGKTGLAIANAWGLSESALKTYAAEASRLVTADADDARRDITAGCRKLFRDAVFDGDAKSAKAVGELWADVAGAKAPEKHQIGALDDLTPAKAREVMAEMFPAPKKSDDDK